MKTKHTEGILVIKQAGEHHKDQISLCVSSRKMIEGREMFQAVARISVNRSIHDKGPSDVEQANAARLALAWNCHDELVEELKAAMEYIPSTLQKSARSILAKATA